MGVDGDFHGVRWIGYVAVLGRRHEPPTRRVPLGAIAGMMWWRLREGTNVNGPDDGWRHSRWWRLDGCRECDGCSCGEPSNDALVTP